MDRPEPHSREWYARQAHERGGYFHPWRRVLDAPDPETTFDLLLTELLASRPRVLEAGCGHGPDAAKYVLAAVSGFRKQRSIPPLSPGRTFILSRSAR